MTDLIICCVLPRIILRCLRPGPGIVLASPASASALSAGAVAAGLGLAPGFANAVSLLVRDPPQSPRHYCCNNPPPSPRPAPPSLHPAAALPPNAARPSLSPPPTRRPRMPAWTDAGALAASVWIYAGSDAAVGHSGCAGLWSAGGMAGGISWWWWRRRRPRGAPCLPLPQTTVPKSMMMMTPHWHHHQPDDPRMAHNTMHATPLPVFPRWAFLASSPHRRRPACRAQTRMHADGSDAVGGGRMRGGEPRAAPGAAVRKGGAGAAPQQKNERPDSQYRHHRRHHTATSRIKTRKKANSSSS